MYCKYNNYYLRKSSFYLLTWYESFHIFARPFKVSLLGYKLSRAQPQRAGRFYIFVTVTKKLIVCIRVSSVESISFE